ncbi:GNAT family N-acetyltransferase [Metabacillus iocasae]|uniref:GNAT family acetyltransferase n=1 Tax=Priestia iocasae TaxID=2291674 RepID=A0ABS2QTK9_9BACI|nr:GNAT family N-acetyltransferase [Metabacillus iocasae]MBM7702337.1 putative GNAT family acetyltransferase [Metabacillus iocasae]
MNYEYHTYTSMPEANVVADILKLHQTIFGASDDLMNKMASKPNLLVMTAMDGKNVIGYKIGYELDPHTFYSWLGGIDDRYRKQGIASILMERQHQYVRNHGYEVVQTKTMNKWRNMLMLNIKSGFDIMDTYTDEKGRHKIILEKNLLKE